MEWGKDNNIRKGTIPVKAQIPDRELIIYAEEYKETPLARIESYKK